MTKVYWLSSRTATFVVEVDENEIIVKTAPICWKWKGKYLQDLIKYFRIDKYEVLEV